MENIINYYYNLFPETIKNRYGGLLFDVNDEEYLLTEINRNPEEVLNIYQLLIQNNIGNFIIIYNKDKEPITKLEDKNYILYKIRCLAGETLNIKETFSIKSKSEAIWSKMWSERINYYEVQVNEIGQDKKIVLQSVYYYIGLAENAIAMASKMEKELNEQDYTVEHYRMNVPVKRGDYFNPNNMLIDISVRDVAEYIKSSFFNNSRDPEAYLDYLIKLQLDNKKANLLFARILYPTYYFDLFDEIILGEREEEDLIHIIKEAHHFESFLICLYEQFSLKYQMIYIKWLKKGTKVPH